MPEQMLCYRAALFLIRRYCPEVLVGMPTDDEVSDITVPARGAAERVVTDTKTDAINKRIKEAKSGKQKESEPAAAAPAPSDEHLDDALI
jgi:uncharacterized protein YbbK (DUF523 family)